MEITIIRDVRNPSVFRGKIKKKQEVKSDGIWTSAIQCT